MIQLQPKFILFFDIYMTAKRCFLIHEEMYPVTGPPPYLIKMGGGGDITYIRTIKKKN
jgi:hypothetical protein